MAAATSNIAVWTADVKREPRYIPIAGRTPEVEVEETPENETGVRFVRVWDCFVDVFRPGCERIRYRVNHRKGRCITFTDRRKVLAGTAGATGIWNTGPAPRAGRPRTLTPTRLPGRGRAADRRRAGRGDRPRAYGGIFFGVANDICKTKCVAAEREA